MTVINNICKSFHNHAHTYDHYAKIQQEIGRRLFERLDYLNLIPKTILDLGCGTGWFSMLLRNKYPKAKIIAMDLAKNMLLLAKKKQTWNKKWQLINSDMMDMPFVNDSFDLIFANQVLHWAESIPTLLNEIKRIININGCFMFTTLGTDTFKELKQAWSKADQYEHINEFYDMHHLGDALLKQGFADPVVDMEILVARYNYIKDLHISLKNQGVHNIQKNRNYGLTSKKAYMLFLQKYNSMKINNKYPLTYEIIYGQAWKNIIQSKNTNLEIRIPINAITKRKLT